MKQIGICILISCIIACNQSKSKKDEQDFLEMINTAPDSATEEKALHPKFDQEKMYGIGIFKINGTKDQTIYSLINQGYRLDSVSTQQELYSMDEKYDFKIRYDSLILKYMHPKSTLAQEGETEILEDYGSGFSWCNDVETFKIKKYIVNGVEIDDLRVRFYKDRIVHLNCGWSQELIDAVESKYGKASKETRSTDIKDLYYNIRWVNGDVESGWSSVIPDFTVEIKGIVYLLSALNKKSHEEKKIADLENNKGNLKNF